MFDGKKHVLSQRREGRRVFEGSVLSGRLASRADQNIQGFVEYLIILSRLDEQLLMLVTSYLILANVLLMSYLI
jgi:hypothetical protein